MSIELLKSILSSVMTAMAFIQIFLMFELFGRSQVRYDAATLKKMHRINGILFLLLYFSVAYFCLRYIRSSNEELSPRVTSHALLALSVIALLGLKLSFIRVYRQFYEKVLTLGPLIALLTLGMMATSGGYYFLVTLFKL